MPNVTRYERRNYRDVLELIYSQQYIHTHFDWYTAERWLDLQSVPVLLAWEGTEVIGVMGVSDPLNGASWMRLLALRDDVDRDAVTRSLWDIMRESLRKAGVKTVWILMANDWVQEHLWVFGAQQVETIVTLRRVTSEMPPQRNHEITIRSANPEADLVEITRIDHAAFKAPWQLSQADLRQAMRVASSCTLALANDVIVGYQLSTRHRESGHLARLAVEPRLHGQGVGGALLHTLLPQFHARGVDVMTVNTQNSNVHSQRLYHYYGFRRNGYDLPVYTITVS